MNILVISGGSGNDALVKGIKKFIRAQKRKGLTRKEIVKKASIKFEVPTKDIRKIYKSIEK